MRKRIELFDLWRSFAILLMVIYHLLYDLYMFDVVGKGVIFSDWAYAIRHCAAASFMLISGAVACHSRSSVKRGAVVFLWGVVISLVMRAFGMRVQFGILHHLGFMMIAYGLLSKKVRVPEGLWFPALCLGVFAITYYICDTVRVGPGWLFPIGLRSRGFTSADYYPLFPWSMLFAIGVWLGAWLQKNGDAKLLQQQYHPALTIAGRHSLPIYIVHQPILYGLCWLLFELL